LGSYLGAHSELSTRVVCILFGFVYCGQLIKTEQTNKALRCAGYYFSLDFHVVASSGLVI
jgi:hypothetical protein